MYLVKCVVFVIAACYPISAFKDVITEAETLSYRFYPVSSSYMQFKVRARADVHVALTTHAQESNPMYELVIGGWANTQSVIRRKTCFSGDKTEVRTRNVLNRGELRSFWISWDDGNILVGREGEEKAFMSWWDPQPLLVNYVGVHTGFGSTGEWVIDNGDGSKSVQTPQHDLTYQFFPISNNSVHFKVRANSDAHIGLSSAAREVDPMYEILIGGWANAKSLIRRKSCFKPEKVAVETSKYLNESEFRGFWMRWDHSRIIVGKEGEIKPFMLWHDLDPIDVAFVGVHTGAGSTGNWKLMDVNRNNVADDVVTGEEPIYQFFPISGKSLQFKVRARNDAHIGLSSLSRESDPMYEILIGGWKNNKSVIRKRCCLPGEKHVVQTPQILSVKNQQGYWMSWEGGNVMAGREGETDPFLHWHDPEPFPINYVGVHTGSGSTGWWQIGNISSLPVVPQNANGTVSSTSLPSATPAVICAPTLTRLRNGTACAGQTIFEENFDTLRNDIWQVQQYVPGDHPELPFISYQPFTVNVTDGHLRVSPVLQQYQPGFTQYSLYSSLDLSNGCTSGLPGSCLVEASGGSSIIPPVVSGRITSKSSFAFTYGTISVRAKLPQGDWIYPEILLEPLIEKFVYGSKNSGMLKIACARGNKNLKKGSTHYGNKVLYSGPVIDTKCHDTFLVSKTSDTFWGDDFHVYSVKWTPERLIIAVDGKEYARVVPRNGGLRANLPGNCAGPLPENQGLAPFNDHFYITLGLAVGGHSEFSDASISQDGRAKPWKNHASKATLNFWNDLDVWYDTWDEPKLLVDYVKVVAL